MLVKQWQLVTILCIIHLGVLVPAEECDMTKVRDCYEEINDDVLNALDRSLANTSYIENFCKKNDTSQRCEEQLAACINPDPPLKAMQALYITTRQRACGNGGSRQADADEEDAVNDSKDEKVCSYKQLKRCLQRQITRIQIKTKKRVAKNQPPPSWIYGPICRKTRQSCHQHSTLESCPPVLQEAIGRMEDSMNTAQELLCKDNQTLLRNLLQSYKFWNVTHFSRCATTITVVHIADYLFATKRLLSECRKMKTKMFGCLRESYTSADEAYPKPDVDGAIKVLAAFLDRMQCVDARDLSDNTNNEEHHNYLGNRDEDMEGEPDAVVTKTSGNGIHKAFEDLPDAATSSVILTTGTVALLSINVILAQFLV